MAKKKPGADAKTPPKNCECDDGHEGVGSVCMPCWEAGFRSWKERWPDADPAYEARKAKKKKKQALVTKQTVIGWHISEGADPDRVGVYVFEHAEGVDAEQALRAAAETWLTTKDGREANENVDGDFNWGDLMLSDKIQKLAKVFLVAHYSSDCVVNHDERLGRD